MNTNVCIKPICLLVMSCCILLLQVGCAGLGKFPEQPKVSIADIQVRETKNMEAAFLVQLRVVNPNEASIDVKGINCDLEIDGEHFATGVANDPQIIPGFGTALVPVTVYASYLNMVSSVFKIIQGGNLQNEAQPLQYKITGDIRGGVSGFAHVIPFENSGSLSLGDLMAPVK